MKDESESDLLTSGCRGARKWAKQQLCPTILADMIVQYPINKALVSSFAPHSSSFIFHPSSF
ncbi:MAG TPA: hypothetical protein VGO57_10840 [Verrucomicrobiae bacterium]|jgi:hypothetical protein